MRIALIIPAYKVADKILPVVREALRFGDKIFVVDDACPQKSGQIVRDAALGTQVAVLLQDENTGVGGATLRGFQAAAQENFDILVKLDGDGQMDPSQIPALINPIRTGKADYTKGNRFYSPRSLRGMPGLRLLGNAGLSFMAKLTTGYWNIMDPTNGFIALHSSLLPVLETERLAKRYFFENDLLFRLSLCRAVVCDVPIPSRYADEKSNLSISHSLFTFPFLFLIRFCKRLAYRYFLRDFSVGSVFLIFGALFSLSGLIFGIYHWRISALSGQIASSGTVMLAALPTLMGFQMFCFAVIYDVLMVPRDALHPSLRNNPGTGQ